MDWPQKITKIAKEEEDKTSNLRVPCGPSRQRLFSWPGLPGMREFRAVTSPFFIFLKPELGGIDRN
jgi:hypothetical protein